MEWKEKCVLGGLLLIASSAIITLAACSSFNLHKDNVIRNAETLEGKALLLSKGFVPVTKQADIELDAQYAIAATGYEMLLTSTYSNNTFAASSTEYEVLTLNENNSKYSIRLSSGKYIIVKMLQVLRIMHIQTLHLMDIHMFNCIN